MIYSVCYWACQLKKLPQGVGRRRWTNATLTPQVSPISAADVRDLRTALGAALTALGIPLPTYTDPTIYNGQGGQRTVVKRDHVRQLREAATRGKGATSGGSGTPVPSDGLDGLTYDAATNRINSAGWEYDSAGNQTRTRVGANSWQRFEYDAAGRLVRVLSDDRSLVLATYTYGESNERLVTDEGGSRTYYVAGGPGVAVEYVEVGASMQPQWSKSYIYLGARLLSVITPNGGGGEYVEYHHPDRLGTRVVTNNSGASYYEQTTLPFGTALNAESTGATNRRFTSYDRSASTGLDYAVNRHYDSQQGRFTQADPLEMDAVSLANPQSLNLYAYCGNDPVNSLDPDGLFFGKLFHFIGKAFKWVGIALAVATVVVTAAIMFAPASSFIFKAALWTLMHVLLPLSRLPVIGAMVPLSGLGSPPWNPNSRSVFGNSWQDPSNPDNLPPCSQPNVLPCVATDVVKTNTGVSPWPAWWDRALDTGVTYFAGMADTQTGGTYQWAGKKLARVFAWGLGGDPNRAEELTAEEYQRMEQSNLYTAGQVTGVVFDVAEGAEAGIAASKSAGWGGRISLDAAHHTFPRLARFGKLSHLQLDLYKAGVKGSGISKRIPLFIKRFPNRNIVLRRWRP